MRGEFKTNKNLRLLTLYQMFLNGQFVDKDTYIIEHGINERTFERDIAEIRNFLSDIYSIHEVLYDNDKHIYYLSNYVPQYVDKMDATIIIKILIESHSLRKDECLGLIDKVMMNVNPHDIKEIHTYLKKDLDAYNSTVSVSILKIVSDLYRIIDKRCDIEITEVEGTRNIISPIKIKMEDTIFYLLARRQPSMESIKINIADIDSFKVLPTNFTKEIKQSIIERSKEE